MARHTMDSIIAHDSVSHGDELKKLSKRITARVALKSKENIREKSKKSMKNKLKKYKLRKDGQDDPDVLDISQCLSSTLTIISPVARNNDIENFKMKNKSNSPSSNIIPKECNDKVGSPSKKQEDQTSSSSVNGSLVEKSLKDVCKKRKKKKEKVASQETSNNSKKPPENKHLNAFQVLMTARHKTIGSNSPGKDNKDCQEDPDIEIEKKELRVKRTLALQKMADLKGGKEKREVETNKDVYIKKKLDERAVRLKKMLVKNNRKNGQTKEMKNSQQVEKFDKTDSKVKNGSLLSKISSTTLSPSRSSKVKIQKSQTIVELVKKRSSNSPPRDYKPSIDDDFLKNLSPSMKKKESMLSYFEKTDKKVVLPDDDIDTIDCEVESTLIRVKFTPRRKKSKLKKRTNLLISEEGNTEPAHCEAPNKKKPCEISIGIDIQEEPEVESKENKDKSESVQLLNENITSPPCSLRPRRNIKRPIKYLSDGEDDVIENNCDDGIIHIFTPKKLRKTKGETQPLENSNSTKSVTPIKILNLNSSKEIVCVRSPKTKNTEIKKKISMSKKSNKEDSAKLAPIFMPKPALEKSVIEARQKFLHSGVPDQLKKIIEKQKQFECILEEYFPVVTHVQQMSCHSDQVVDTTSVLLDNLDDQEIDSDDLWKRKISMKQFLDSCSYSVESDVQKPKKKTDIKQHKKYLKEIKDAYPEFPVYRTYKFLKEKHTVENKDVEYTPENKDDNVQNSSFEVLSEISDIKGDLPEHFMWSDKYKASSSTEIIGNFKSVNFLKKWLSNWKEYNEEKVYCIRNSQSRLRRDSDSWLDDSDSHDSSQQLNNVTLVTGPQGCGKTSAVYAVATELSIKVLEVNASAKRTGKKLLSDLQEATQSHKVNRNKGLSQENSQNSQDCDVWDKTHKRKLQFGKTYSKKEKKTVLSQSEDPIINDSQKQESTHVMSLILIEDADLVFEQDDGFISALTQIVQYSKRPIIIVTGNVHCAHLQRFIQGNNVLQFKPLSPKMLGTWLDLLVLVEKDDVHPKLGSCLLELFKGDIRKAINTLQFWIGSSSYRSSENSVNSETQISPPEDDLFTDENSSSSWSEGAAIPARHGIHSDLAMFDVVKSFTSYCYERDMKSKKLFKMQYPTILSNIWWNVPAIWNSNDNSKVDKIVKKSTKSVGSESQNLNELTKFLDILSVADCVQASSGICQSSPDLSLRPWLMSPASSVSDSEDLSMFNRHKRFESDWSYFAVSTCLKQINRKLGGLDEFHNLEFSAPATKETRERDTIYESHETLYEAIPSANQLERRSLATDYLPALRRVARIEKERADNNAKRNNRFCHYMRSLRIPCNTRVLDSLCSSLDTKHQSYSASEMEQS